MASKENQEALNYMFGCAMTKDNITDYEEKKMIECSDIIKEALDDLELKDKALENSCLYILNEDTPKLDCKIKSKSEGYCEYDNNENNECIKCIKGCLLEQARKELSNGNNL